MVYFIKLFYELNVRHTVVALDPDPFLKVPIRIRQKDSFNMTLVRLKNFALLYRRVGAGAGAGAGARAASKLLSGAGAA
jgi:hypothetical protein